MSPFIPKLDTIDEDAPLVYFSHEEVEVNDTNSNNGVNANENESHPRRPHRKHCFERLRERLPKGDNLIDSIILVNTQVMKFFADVSAIGAEPELAQPSEPQVRLLPLLRSLLFSLLCTSPYFSPWDFSSWDSSSSDSSSLESSSSSDSSSSLEDLDYCFQPIMDQHEYQNLTRTHYQKLKEE